MGETDKKEEEGSGIEIDCNACKLRDFPASDLVGKVHRCNIEKERGYPEKVRISKSGLEQVFHTLLLFSFTNKVFVT